MEYIVIFVLVVISALALVRQLQSDIKGCGGGCQACQYSCAHIGKDAVRLTLKEDENHVE